MNASIACHAAGGRVIVAGSSRPAWTEGGLSEVRRGSVVAGSSRPAWTEGGLRQMRPGSVVAGSSRPAWTEGGLRKARAGSVVTGSSRPAWTEGGLRQMRPGSASPVSSLAGRWSPVDLAEDRVDRAHDRHDVGDLVSGHDVRQHREIRERRASPFQSVRLGPAVAHDVAPDLAARAFDARV